MKTLLIGFVLFCRCMVGATPCDPIQTECSLASNFTFDILGVPDTRPQTIGLAGAQYQKITFSPPAGYRVRISRAVGDFATVPIGAGAAGGIAGALVAMQSTAGDASKFADWAQDSCFLYLQVFTKGEAQRAPYDMPISKNGTLESDNVLVVKVAVFMNTLGVPVHMEPSFVLWYRFEKL